MTLSGRLKTGFGLVLALLLSITLLALLRMDRMDDRVRDIVEVHNRRIALSQAMMNDINAMSIAIVSLGIAQDSEGLKYNTADLSNAFRQYDVSRRIGQAGARVAMRQHAGTRYLSGVPPALR
jgi:methyl-accepting chemotaxis protein